jgi:glycosyltransferase involved in cell wall biosynthesis
VKILVLNWRDVRSPEAGGSEIHLHEILRRLVLRGHEATLVCSQFVRARGPRQEVVDGIETIRVGAWWNAHLTVPRAAIDFMRRERFDVLLDDVNKIPFFAPSFSDVPVVALFHHLLGNTVFLETNPLFAAAVSLYERRIGPAYRRTPAIAVSRSTESDLHRLGLRDVTVIPPGQDTGLYQSGQAPRSRDPLVVVVSRLKRYKRVDVAIRAMPQVLAAVPGARLVVIGDGGEEDRLKALAKSIDAPVTFLGRVSDAEKVRYLASAQVVVNPSMKEGWGMVGVEALACGTPVVASDVHGHRDSIPEGAGVLVPYGDVRATAAAVIDLLRDEKKRRAFGARGITWASRFSWDRVTDRFESAFARACGIETAAEPAFVGVTP